MNPTSQLQKEKCDVEEHKQKGSNKEEGAGADLRPCSRAQFVPRVSVGSEGDNYIVGGVKHMMTISHGPQREGGKVGSY